MAQDVLALQLGRLHLDGFETLTLVVALAVALASAAGLWRIGMREDRQDRLRAVRRAAAAGEARSDADRDVDGPHPWSRLTALLMQSPLVRLVGRERALLALVTAGFRGEHDFTVVVVCKIVGAVGLPTFYWWLGMLAGKPTLRLAVGALCLLIGLFLPEFVLARLAARRKRRLEDAIPDALDLLVICAEAGLAMQPAMQEVARTLARSSPDIAAEFAITGAELHVLPDRATALENLAKRTGIDSLRGVIATLNQSMRFGTSLAEALRVLAGEMRAGRLARLEEGAARLPVLLAIPLMLFLMPALMIVIMSPVALRVIDVISNSGLGK